LQLGSSHAILVGDPQQLPGKGPETLQ